MTTRRTEYPTGETYGAAPGGVVGGGRYRLVAQCGIDERMNAHLWRAHDSQLERDVALTLIVGDNPSAVRRSLELAAYAAALSHPGKAGVLDVLSPGSGISATEGLIGIIVADWTLGTDLLDLVADRPMSPAAAASLLLPLASAAELAHHTGLVLGLDHPQRIRVTPESTLKVAFAGPMPDATPQDDVRGLGAILYLLLTGRWPLLGGPASVPAAPVNPDGSIVAPRALYPYIPQELSTAALRCLSSDTVSGIRTSAGLIRVLDRTRVDDEDRTQQFHVITDEEDVDDDGTVWTTRRPTNDKATRRKLAIGVTALAVATVGVLAWVGMQLISFLGPDTPSAGGPTVVATAPPAGSGGPPPPQVGQPIQPAGVRVYNVKGTADNAKRANRTVDGNPATSWKTDVYAQPFPALKPGIGIIASFAEPVSFAEVIIDSPSDGTVVEIRTSPSERPALDETKVIGTAKLQPGQTKLQLASAEPSQNLLIWITTLGDGNVSELSEIRFMRARTASP